MAVAPQMLCTCFFILLPAIVAESGSGEAASCEVCEDAELDASFACLTRIPKFQTPILVCNITGIERSVNEAQIGFAILESDGKTNRPCPMASQLGSRCNLKGSDFLDPIQVCLSMTSMKPQCQELNATDIIKPEAPFGLKITYQEATNEYLVKFSTPHVPISYLANKLIHEIAYRQENKTWDTTVQVDYLELKLQGKDLEPDTTYEIKVRSKPNGQRFHGIWSDWSLSAFIKTQARKPDVINYGEQDLSMMVAFILGFIVLLLIISLVPIFWKNRIKPIVWPALPNHDKTLDKLCNKLKKNSDLSCFDPESLGYAHIHTVNSIQAKSEVNCFQQPLLAWDAGVLETTGKGPDQTSLIHINHGWLKLPLAYEGMWPAEMLKRGLGRSNHANGDPFISASLCSGSSSGSQHGCSEASSTNSASSILMPSAPTIPPGLQAELYTNNETRVSSEEEAYITMASFSQKQGEPGAWQCWHMA